MENSLISRFETKKYRLKRHAKDISFDIVKVGLLITVISAISFLMILLYNFIITSPVFRIHETVVRGCRELTEKDILAQAGVKANQNLLAINMDAMARRISTNPWIEKVAIGRELPDRLVIEVQERRAVALIKMDEGMYLLDNEGIIFKKMENGDEIDIPILTGCYHEGRVNEELLRKSLDLFRYLSTSQEFPTISSISEVRGDEIFGFSLFTNNGFCLHLGFDCYENKLKRLVPIIADLDRRNLRSSYLNIDISDPVIITVKRSNIFGPTEPIPSKGGYRT